MLPHVIMDCNHRTREAMQKKCINAPGCLLLSELSPAWQFSSTLDRWARACLSCIAHGLREDVHTGVWAGVPRAHHDGEGARPQTMGQHAETSVPEASIVDSL